MPELALPEIATKRLCLRHARPGNEAETVLFFTRNQAHFERWDPPAPEDFYTVSFWRRNLARSVEDFHADRAVRFDVFDLAMKDAPILGRIGFSQIFRGPFQSCMLGYQIDAQREGQGLMFEALRAAIDYMFEVKGLHRVQANHLEENERSARLLARLGFVREGLAREYLFIGGLWRDHITNACINPLFDDKRLMGPAGARG